MTQRTAFWPGTDWTTAFFALAAAMALALTGCGGSDNTPVTPVTPAPQDAGQIADDAGESGEDAGEEDASAPDAGNDECGEGLHDGGDGACVPQGECSEGFHNGGDGSCVAAGICVEGYHDSGIGSCVPLDTCARGYHDGGDGSCVELGTCIEAFHNGGDGACVPQGECSEGFHDGGDGSCAAEGACVEGYHDSGTGSCVSLGTCARGYHDGGDGSCVELGTCIEGLETDGDGDCLLEFVKIPPGGFTLTHYTGSHNTNDKISLNLFKLSRNPITVGQYQKCIDAGACKKSDLLESGNTFNCRYSSSASSGGNRNYPINCVTWKGADRYCTWIGGRLPSEEEWEYASTHDGTGWKDTKYPWGNEAPNHCETSNYKSNDGRLPYCDGNTACAAAAGPAPVGTYPKGNSPLGLADMAGNVRDWTSSPWTSGSVLYTIKGADFTASIQDLPVITRGSMDPERQAESVSFRCAK